MTKTLKTILALLSTLLLSSALLACGPTTFEVPQGTMPAGASWQGEWYSTQYEKMLVTQEGNTIKGTFSYRTGGTFEGEMKGDVVYFEWVQPGDMSQARAEIRGHGYWRMSEDGATFEGEWGYHDDHTGGGKWEGERISDDRPADPIDPEEKVF